MHNSLQKNYSKRLCEYCPWGLYYKTYYGRNLWIFVISYSVCLWPGLARKYWTGLERLARDKHSSLLLKSVNYGRNKFYSTGPWDWPRKTFYDRITKLFLRKLNIKCP
jgi:hypothetical protein